jgi:Zn-finger nucleic acid-binding protein/Zn-dependent protease with chaperone function
MDDFWVRRKRANREENLAELYLALGLVLYLLVIYALLRSAVSAWIVEGPLALSREEAVAVLILVLSSTWIFVRTLEQNATSLMVAGLGARALKHDRSDEAGLQDLVDDLVKETGVVRLEVLICEISAVNFFALKTFEGRNMIFVTQGALNRLDTRLIKAGLAQCMVRLNQPEVRAWSAYCFIFASLQQFRLGFKNVGKRSNVSAIAGFRFLGGLVSILGLPLRLNMNPERVLDADKDAACVTRDPVALAELISRLHVQWTGSSHFSPALNVAALSDLRWTPWVGKDPKLMRTQSTEQMSPVTRIKKTFALMQMGVAPLFKIARSKREQRRDEDSSDTFYRVIHKGRVEGPHSTSEIQQLNWMSTRAVVQSINGGAPNLAFEFAPLRRLYAGRFQPCPRCGISLSPYVHQKVEMHRCMKCHGILAPMKPLQSLGIEELPEMRKSAALRQMKRMERRANAFLNRPASEGGRVYPESKCPDCRKPMTFVALPYKGMPLALSCKPCGRAWFDAEELSALLKKLDRLISWDRVLKGQIDALLPHPDLEGPTKEDKARAAGVKISKRNIGDFMRTEGEPRSASSPEDADKITQSEPKPEPKKGLIRGAFVPRNAEDVRRERTLKARRDRFRQDKLKRGAEDRPKPDDSKD